MNNEAMASAMDALTGLDVDKFWLEIDTGEHVESEASVATTGDSRVLLAHHLLTMAQQLDQSLEETAEEAVEIAGEHFYEVAE